MNLLRINEENLLTFLKKKRYIIKKEAEKTIVFVNAQMKIRYDFIKTSLNLNVKEFVYLKLYKEYTQSDLSNRKFNKQRFELIKILEKIEK